MEKYIDLMMQADRYLTDKEKSAIELYFELNADSAAEYNALKVQYPDALVGFEQVLIVIGEGLEKERIEVRLKG